MNELGKENITQEFTLKDLIQQAIEDDSWEPDAAQRKACAMGLFFNITRYL